MTRPSIRGDPAAVETRAQLLAILADDPGLATPRLVETLRDRVQELHRTDARAAGELAECAWLAAERAGDLKSRALAHRARALAALAAGRQREVLADYEEAERLYRDLGDEVERARVLRSMIDPLMHLGRYDEAMSAADEAREVFRAHGETVLAAQVDANVGNVHHRLGRDAESLDAYARAVDAFRKAGDEDAAAVIEFNRANVFAERSELAEARRGYRRALRHYRSRGERLRESQCRYQLAYLAFLAGRYSQALRDLDRVRAVERELGDERHAALCTLDETELLLSLNAWEEARRQATLARAELAELGLAQEAVKATLWAGLGALHLRRWREAGERLSEAESGFRREGNEVLAALASLYRAEIALRRGEPVPALEAAHAAVEIFEVRALAAKAAYARIVAGRALAALDRPAFARGQALAALEGLERSPSPDVTWRAHALLAELAENAGPRRRHLRAAIADLERLRARIVPDELQASYQRDKIGIYESLALTLLLGDGDPSDPEAAFEVVESAKGRVLGDRLAGARVELEPPAGERAKGRGPGRGLRRRIEELDHLRRRLNEAEREEASRSAAEPIREAISRREAELAHHLRRLQLDRASRGGWIEVAAERRAARRDTLSDLREILAPRETVVSYAFLKGVLHAFVVDRKGLRWAPMIAARGEIEEALGAWIFLTGKTALGSAYLEAHADALRAAELHALDRLHALVWEPIEGLFDDPAAIVVIPAGPLFYLPFHALRDGRSHLIEGRAVSIAPSARALLALDRAGGRKLALETCPLVLGYEVEGLPGIAREVAAVRARLPGAKVLTGASATRAALRRHGAGATILHLAAHAEFRGDNPLLSSIELADGRLTFYDLFDLRLDADLAVLSGCQTGRHAVLEGDELLGLARGFQYAGVRALVASLWPVEDRVAAGFMDRFYARLGAGEGVREALRGTMRERIGEGRPPHEWAAFTLSGRTPADREESRS
jgi:tetratricopeptide (TPR) repeat protein